MKITRLVNWFTLLFLFYGLNVVASTNIVFPIINGQLQSSLNAGHTNSITNIAGITFADGTSQTTAGGGGGSNSVASTNGSATGLSVSGMSVTSSYSNSANGYYTGVNYFGGQTTQAGLFVYADNGPSYIPYIDGSDHMVPLTVGSGLLQSGGTLTTNGSGGGSGILTQNGFGTNTTLTNINIQGSFNSLGATNLPNSPYAVGDMSTYRIEAQVSSNQGSATQPGFHPYLSSVLYQNGLINLYCTSWSNQISNNATNNFARFYVQRGKTWAEVFTNTPTLVFSTNQNGMTGQAYVAGAWVYSENGTNVWDYFSGSSGGFENTASMKESECYTLDGTNFINSGNNPMTSLVGGTWHSANIYYGPIVKGVNGTYHKFPAADNGAWESTGHQTGPTMFGPWTDLTNVFMPLGPTNQIVNDLVCIIPRNNGTYIGIGRGVGAAFAPSAQSVITAYTCSDSNLNVWNYIGVISTPDDDIGLANLNNGVIPSLYGPNVFNNAGQPWIVADDDLTGIYLLTPGTLYSPVINIASNNAMALIQGSVGQSMATNIVTNAIVFNTNQVITTGFTTPPTYEGVTWTWNSTLQCFTNIALPGAGIVVQGNPLLSAFNVDNGFSIVMALTNATDNFLNLPHFDYTTGDSTFGQLGWYDFNATPQPAGHVVRQILNTPQVQSGGTNLSSATTVTIAFTTPFPDTNYTVIIQGVGTALAAPDVTAKTTNTFSVSMTSFTGHLDWTAMEHTQ